MIRDEDYTRTRLGSDFPVMRRALMIAHDDWLERHGATAVYETQRTRCNIIRDRAVQEIKLAVGDCPWIKPVEDRDLVVFNWHGEYLVKIKKASDKMDIALTGAQLSLSYHNNEVDELELPFIEKTETLVYLVWVPKSDITQRPDTFLFCPRNWVIDLGSEAGSEVTEITPPSVTPSDLGESRVRIRRPRQLEGKNNGEAV